MCWDWDCGPVHYEGMRWAFVTKTYEEELGVLLVVVGVFLKVTCENIICRERHGNIGI
jgi:hypothetical protein